MAKSSLEKAFDKQRREAKRIAEKEARHRTAESIVNGQPIIGGMRIMDNASEEVLKAILDVYDGNDSREVHGNDSVIPVPYKETLNLEFDKLMMYGVITSSNVYISAVWNVILSPQGIQYFELKQQAIKKQEENDKMSVGNITNYGNMVFGNVLNSSLSVDNSIQQIERMIDDNGGEDAEELHKLFEEVKELVENIQTTRSIPKQKRLFSKLSDHVSKHGWFYGAVVQLIGTVAINMMGTK